MKTLYKNLHQKGTMLSKNTNHTLLGDRTSRTITRTIMDGVYRLTNGQLNLTGFDTHLLMFGAGFGLISKDKKLRAIGLILLALLIIFYLAGR